MIPQKSKSLYKEVAEELNIPIDLVEDLIEYYYKEVKSNITGLKHLRINVDGLGQFVAKPKAVAGSIDKITKSLDDHDTSTFKAYHNKKAMENKLELLLKLSSKLEQVNTRKEEFLKTKNNEERT